MGVGCLGGLQAALGGRRRRRVTPLQVQEVDLSQLDSAITEEFIYEMKDAFNLFDEDGSGTICSKEMPTLLRAMGWNPTEAEVNTIMAEVDVDHNGKMDLAEFIVMMHNQVGSSDTMEEMRIAFRAFDTDGDGRISKEEFRVCMLNFGERFLEEDIELMVRLADHDDNGFIDFEEFVRMLTMDEEEGGGGVAGNTHSRMVASAFPSPRPRRPK